MNVVSLVLHGLTAMSVYADTIFARILLAAAFVAATATFGIATVVGIRTATDLAIPGWATVAAGDLLIHPAADACYRGCSDFDIPGESEPTSVCSDRRLSALCRSSGAVPAPPVRG